MSTPTLHTKKPELRWQPDSGVVPAPSKEKNMSIVQQSTDNVNAAAPEPGVRVRVLVDPFAGWSSIANESTPRAGDVGVVVPHPSEFAAASALTSVRLDRTGQVWTFASDALKPVGHPKLAPIACLPWCKDQDGHPQEIHPDDQHCTSTSELVALSLEPQWQSWDGGWNSREIEVFADSGPTRHPAIVIYDCGAEHQVTLDLREARALSQAIAKIADLMEAAR